MPDEAVDSLVQVTDFLYSTMEAAEGAATLGRAGQMLRQDSRTWGGLQMKAATEFLRERNTALALRFEQAADTVLTHIRPLLDRSLYWLPQGSYFRRAEKRTTSWTAWHIDAEAASTIRFGTECVTVWIPLTRVGGDSGKPSLELICGSHRLDDGKRLVPRSHRAAEWVSTIDGERLVPQANGGDAVIFTQFTLHRTQHIKEQREPRTSCEFRFTTQQPLDYRETPARMLVTELARRGAARISRGGSRAP
jgi:ectoine hydroxylase-related dioxygenase (phytanoyl-CoA dioxygenase family)